MNTAYLGRYRAAIVTTIVAVLVFAVLILSPSDAWFKRKAAGLVDTLIWDGWYRNTAEWKGNAIILPAGKYKWVESTTGLVIVRRESEPLLIVSLSSTVIGAFDEKRFVTELCKEGRKCKDVRFSQWKIGHTDASVVEYISLADRELHEAYVRPNSAPLLIHVVTDLDVESDTVRTLVDTIVSQLKG